MAGSALPNNGNVGNLRGCTQRLYACACGSANSRSPPPPKRRGSTLTLNAHSGDRHAPRILSPTVLLILLLCHGDRGDLAPSLGSGWCARRWIRLCKALSHDRSCIGTAPWLKHIHTDVLQKLRSFQKTVASNDVSRAALGSASCQANKRA
ncbi:uncharacterized protein BO95DRAFT_156030 [Aspergillus brunneoviolaceus CBS 621.78]|uniref:Uncharacterized protein n=1 Tax=Aspergillus brunneoviolaceus CBS 621.78 TaxID=1450534 RepID=A0ACD1GMI4_9EURO|nr:hypothetical protein BO95DRAFT_156030 [Aspergillus brunneoviolaceus CBS 621.78]RAH50481.1 hypothetical protein BO95DRAFT_156030 [Aspergillus brunneoviolaceus CBS 621.78]